MRGKKHGLYEDYSVTELGAVFGIATNSLKDKINKANVEPSKIEGNGKRKKYRIYDVYSGLMALKEKENAEKSLEEPRTHKERLDMLKAEEQEMINKKLKNQLVEKDEVLSEFTSALTKIKTRMLLVPKKMAPRAIELLDAVLIEDEMETEIRQILEELSEYDT